MRQAQFELDQFFIYRLLSTLLLFGILAEWLTPWLSAGEWTELIQPRALIILIAIILVAGIFRLPVAMLITVGVLSGMLMMVWLFRGEDQSSWNWLVHFFPNLGQQMMQMLKYGIVFMSDEIRMLLLFTGWLLLASALQSLIWHHQLAFSLVSVTVVYLLFLYMTIGIDVFGQLVRVISEGLLLLALTHMARLRRKLNLNEFRITIPVHQVVSIVLLITIIMSSSIMLSGSKERHMEPIAWATVFSDALVEEMTALSTQITGVPLKTKEGGSYVTNSVGVSGYSQDDATLGQTITPSKEIVFHGWSSLKGYWRAEAKTEYDGNGWLDQAQTLTLQHIAESSEEALQSWQSGKAWTGARIKQEIEYVKPIQGMPIMQSGIKGVVLDLQAQAPARSLQNYIVGEETSTLYAPTTDSIIKKYTLYTELPITDGQVLRDIEPLENEQAEKLWQEDSLARYLQLPENLPDRIAALATEVSGAGLTSRYDQVKAIEDYLKNNYKYTLNSSLPAADEDFVDHFLFEQQQGYCVHFSTAMVIMLRTQEIPARWVKGYQMGEAIDSRSNEAGVVETLYEVRQSDAHAWVEVYFPTVGWVPFDPTPAIDEASTDNNVFSNLQMSWKQWLADANQLVGGVTAGQWLIGLSSAAVIVVLSMILLVFRHALRVERILSSYKRAYRRYSKHAEELKQYTGLAAEQSLPGRNKAQIAELHQNKHNMHISTTILHNKLVAVLAYMMKHMEHKARIDHSTASQLTWRNRMKTLQAMLSGEVRKQELEAMLVWVEQSTYNNPSAQQYPHPQEVRSAVKGILNSALNMNQNKTAPKVVQASESVEQTQT